MDSVVQRVEAPRARPEEPSSGLGQLITGAIMTGVGAVNLATSPVCVADFYVRDNGSGASNVCLYSTLIFGGVVAGVGLPLLIVGVNKRSEHQAWEREWGDLAVLPTPGGVALAWGIRL